MKKTKIQYKIWQMNRTGFKNLRLCQLAEEIK